MTRKASNLTPILNVICAVLMLVLLVLQFMPFWTYGDPATSVSIQGYIWFPGDHTGLSKAFTESVSADYSINDVLLMPILTLMMGAVGIVLCLIQSDNPFVSLLPAACGLAGTWGYLTGAAFHLGSGWVFHLILCIALLALGLISLISLLSARQK